MTDSSNTAPNTFPQLLKAFQAHEIGYRGLEKGLIADLTANPDKRESYINALNNLSANGVITKVVFDDLMAAIDENFAEDQSAPAPQTVEPEPSEPKPEPQNEVQTQTHTHTNDFDVTLDHFLAHRMSYQQLEAALKAQLGKDIAPDEQNKTHCLARLQAEQGTLNQAVFDALLEVIEPGDSEGNSEGDSEGDSDEQDEAQDAPQGIADDSQHDTAQVSADEDKTQIKIKKAPVAAESSEADADKTQIKTRTKRADDTSTTSTTSSTTKTSVTSGTQSTWSKPFEHAPTESQIGIGTILKGRFKITEFIGHGGMGDVFKAEDLRNVEAQDTESEIAVKVLNKEFREHRDSLKSLQREAKKTRQLAHPHIVNVFDFDRDEHNVFMTMELMVGDPLNKAIKKNPDGFPINQVYQYVSEMGSALHYAHSRGVIHCDFKPGNIFLSAGEIKVFDFGIARAAKSGMGEEAPKDQFDAGDIGALTPSYASPEMLDDTDDPEAQDDIYALGCITYELLTGSHPFIGEDGKKIPANKAKEQGLQPKKIETLKSWQWEALKGCLEFSRESRTASVNQFTEEFITTDKPISPKIKLAAAAVILGLGLAGYYGLEYKKQNDIDTFVALVNSSRHDEIKQRLKDLMDADKDEKQRYFSGEQGEAALINYFITHVKSLSDKDDYQIAEDIVALALNVYSRLTDISQMSDTFDKSRNKRIAELDAALVTLLTSEEFTAHYPELKTLWDTLRRVDKDNSKLSDTGTALELEDSIQQLIAQGAYGPADKLADFSMALLTGNPVFDEYITSIERIKKGISNRIDKDHINKQIAELENKLLNFDKSSTLADYQRELTTIKALMQIAPDNEVLSQVHGEFKQKLAAQLQTQIDDIQWDAATASIALYEPILSSTELNQYSEQVATAKVTFDDQTDALVRQITIISDSATPDNAKSVLNSLVEHRASEQTIADAKDIIAKGWLKQAKKASGQQNWQNARQAIQSGLAMASSDEVKTQLQSADSDLTTAQAAGSNQLSEAEQQRIALEKTQAISTLAKQIRQSIQLPSMTIAQATETLKLIDDLEVLEQTNGLIDSGKDKVAELLQAYSTTLANTDLEQALAFSNEAYKLMPTAEKLAAVVADIKQRISADKDSQKLTQLASLASQIENVLGGVDFHQKAAELEKLVKDYEQNEADNTYSGATRTKIAQRFVTYAESLKEQQRFDEANSAIDSAERFSSALNTIKLVKQQIATAKADHDKNKDLQRQQAKSDSLKQSFAVQIKAQDVKQAEATLKALKALGGNEVFVETEGNVGLLNILNTLIDQATQNDDLTLAIGWLEKQVEYSSQPDKSRADLARYKTAQDIKVASTVNPENAKTLLATALQQYPNDPLIKALGQKLGQTPASATTPTTPVANPDGITYFPSEQKCDISMAGRGKSTRQTCYDKVNAKDKGPRMVVLPKHNGNHFAISRYEITIGDYNTYCKASGDCTVVAGESKLMPVTGLSLAVMQKYSGWLSQVTGVSYKLPTYQQWQFAAQGKANASGQNYKNCKAYSGGNLVRGTEMHKVSYNSKKSRNSWGFTHYLGNASEVVKNGADWFAVGGSWNDKIESCTIDNQDSVSGNMDEFTGFRLVREI